MRAEVRHGDHRRHVVHVVYRFATGGLENGIVNLLDAMPVERYRHTIVALTEVTNFRHRFQRRDVDFFALHKAPGHGVWLYPRLYRLFRDLAPDIVHTRNLAALEAVVPARLAGVPARIHGEHGRDVEDPDGTRRRYQHIRRLYRPFVSHYVALSRDLADYLHDRVRVPRARITQAYNGVDAQRFTPANGHRVPIPGCPFAQERHWLVGTVGRMQAVKDQTTLARAFILALQQAPDMRARLRLVMVGDGPLRAQAQALLDQAGVSELCWLPGERHDVADVMRGLSCFVLPSLGEGISNTILEAMASGLPVIATAVGGNAELVSPGRTGVIVPARDPQALAGSLLRLAAHPNEAAALGRAGRVESEARFSMAAMVSTYLGVYDRQLSAARGN